MSIHGSSILSNSTEDAGTTKIVSSKGDGAPASITLTNDSVIVGGASDKVSLFGATAVVQRSAYTQTYSTADRTHAARTANAPAAATAAALTDSSGGSANTTVEACGTAVTGVDGTASNAASKADVDTRLTAIANNFADVAAQINALITDVANLRTELTALRVDHLDTAGVVNAVVDDFQSLGICA